MFLTLRIESGEAPGLIHESKRGKISVVLIDEFGTIITIQIVNTG